VCAGWVAATCTAWLDFQYKKLIKMSGREAAGERPRRSQVVSLVCVTLCSRERASGGSMLAGTKQQQVIKNCTACLSRGHQSIIHHSPTPSIDWKARAREKERAAFGTTTYYFSGRPTPPRLPFFLLHLPHFSLLSSGMNRLGYLRRLFNSLYFYVMVLN